jgi:hypothetical protein
MENDGASLGAEPFGANRTPYLKLGKSLPGYTASDGGSPPLTHGRGSRHRITLALELVEPRESQA